MKIVIGRDATSGCLRIRRDNEKPQLIKGTEGTSPQVSKEHVELETQDGEHFILTNLNEDNVTYVDNVPVVRFALNRGIPIALGIERQPLLWKILDPYLPKYADIRHLKTIWEQYKNEEMKLQILIGKNNSWKMLSGILSPILMFGGFMIPSLFGYELNSKEGMIIRLLCMLPVVLLGGFFMWKSFKDAERFPKMREDLKNWLQKNYVCPKCGTPFGMMDYTMLSSRQVCGSCKAKFIT